ncbi:MAG: NnrU family protein [Pseudomonadota bacterium]
MGFLLLIVGLALWTGAHYFKRLAPEARAKLGEPGKGLVTILLLISLGAMIYGYRWAPFIEVWSPPSVLRHINNLLMLVAFYVYLSAMAAPNLKIARIGHPQLIGFKIWAVAHLLVNGDLASILLFGGLLAWAVGSVILINKQDGKPVRSETAPIKSEAIMALVGVTGFVAIAVVHILLGVNPFG